MVIVSFRSLFDQKVIVYFYIFILTLIVLGMVIASFRSRFDQKVIVFLNNYIDSDRSVLGYSVVSIRSDLIRK